MLASLASCATGSAQRAGAEPIRPGVRYVAMGSSFAAGPGLPAGDPPRKDRCNRSTKNSAHLLAEKRGLSLLDVSCGGALALSTCTVARRAEVAGCGTWVAYDRGGASPGTPLLRRNAMVPVPRPRGCTDGLPSADRAPYHPNGAGMAAIADVLERPL